MADFGHEIKNFNYFVPRLPVNIRVDPVRIVHRNHPDAPALLRRRLLRDWFEPNPGDAARRAGGVADDERVAFEIGHGKFEFAYHRVLGRHVADIEINLHAVGVLILSKPHVHRVASPALRHRPDPDAVAALGRKRNLHLAPRFRRRDDMRELSLCAINRLV